MIIPMGRLEIVGHMSCLYPTLEEIQRWGKLQIEGIPVSNRVRGSLLRRIFFGEEQRKERDVCVAMEKAFGEIVSHIPGEIYFELKEKLKDGVTELPTTGLDEAGSFVSYVQDKLQPLVLRRQDLLDEMDIILEYKKIASMLLGLLSGYDLERRWEIIGITISKSESYVIRLLKEELDVITSHNYAVFPSEPYNDRIVIIIGYENPCADQVERLLFGTGIKTYAMPSKFRNRPLDVTLALMKERMLVLPLELKEVEGELREFFLENGARILLMRADNQDHLLRFRESSNFAQTKYTFVVRGWAPAGEMHALKASLEDKFHGLVIVKKLRVKTTDVEHAPVVLRNPKVMRPFERLVDIYALPKYGTIDPTASLFFFFPLFFGVVLGDVGYGLVLAVFAGLMYMLSGGRQNLKDFSLISLTFSVCSIAFGFLYGELFGVRTGLKPVLAPLARGHAEGGFGVILNFLVLTISFGVLHIFYGLVLGIIVSFRRGNVSKMLEDFARVIILFGIVFIVCEVAGVLPPIFLIVGIVFLTVSIPSLIYVGGLVAGLEVSSLIGNVLSYCRLMALGMGSVYIVFVGDELDYLIENEVLGKMVLVIVHVFNMVVHIAVPTIHALRLHYVEFFTKFFVPGGRPFEPIRKTEVKL